jgi:hypothetical protein
MSGTKAADATTMIHEKDAIHLEKVDSQDSEEHRNVVGRNAEDLKGYWASWRLVGSMLAIALMGNSLFVGYAMPVS